MMGKSIARRGGGGGGGKRIVNICIRLLRVAARIPLHSRRVIVARDNPYIQRTVGNDTYPLIPRTDYSPGVLRENCVVRLVVSRD